MAKALKAGKHNGNVVSGRVQIGISLYDVTVQKPGSDCRLLNSVADCIAAHAIT